MLVPHAVRAEAFLGSGVAGGQRRARCAGVGSSTCTAPWLHQRGKARPGRSGEVAGWRSPGLDGGSGTRGGRRALGSYTAARHTWPAHRRPPRLVRREHARWHPPTTTHRDAPNPTMSPRTPWMSSKSGATTPRPPSSTSMRPTPPSPSSYPVRTCPGRNSRCGRAETSRRVHLLDLFPRPPPTPLRRRTRRPADLPRLRGITALRPHKPRARQAFTTFRNWSGFLPGSSAMMGRIMGDG